MLRQATQRVAAIPGCQLLARSSWHETVPIGGPARQGDFLNAALLLDCSLPPLELAAALHSIESQLGRKREIRWDARTLDIDLLLYDSEVFASPELTIPHPRMSFRRFVLQPAAEIAGFLACPVCGWTLSQLLRHLQNAPRYVAVASAHPAISNWLAEGLCRELGSPRLEALCHKLGETGDFPDPVTVESNVSVLGGPRQLPRQKNQELSQQLHPNHLYSQHAAAPVISACWLEASNSAASNYQSAVRPVVRATSSPEVYAERSASMLSPALMIVVEPESEKNFLKKLGGASTESQTNYSCPLQLDFAKALKCQGQGPVARIQADDPALVLQEAVAAIRSCWPELSVLSPEEFS